MDRLNKRVFISRDLHADSVFLQKCETAGLEVSGQSLLNFHPLPFSLPMDYDWIFFYSQKAVQFFFEQVAVTDINGAVAAMGPATARALEKIGLSVDFCGNGRGAETAPDFLKVAQNKRVLFPRAHRSRKTIQYLLTRQIQAIDLVVYDNSIKTDFQLEEMGLLVFTSPMNAEAYFNKYSWSAKQRVIAIGTTTQDKLEQLGVTNIELAEETSEAALAKQVLAGI